MAAILVVHFLVGDPPFITAGTAALACERDWIQWTAAFKESRALRALCKNCWRYFMPELVKLRYAVAVKYVVNAEYRKRREMLWEANNRSVQAAQAEMLWNLRPRWRLRLGYLQPVQRWRLGCLQPVQVQVADEDAISSESSS